tara:strand:+ start:251 stop:1273 length:1023 start_codon:yes stop_codon:yes gene_type:complete
MGKNNSSPTSYFNCRLFDKIVKKKRMSKIEFLEIPKFHEFEKLVTINYNVKQLKAICKEYKQKKGGNKGQLIYRMYNYLKYSYYAVKIQKVFRKHIIIKYFHLKGKYPPKMCVNETDFVTLTNLKEIPFNQFFCCKDEGGFVYGFDVCSLYNYIEKDSLGIRNPYSRAKFNINIIKNMHDLIRISKIIKRDISVTLENDSDKITDKKKFEFKVMAVFSKMDDLGNITDARWFLNLTRQRYVLFIKELHDIWFYRASLTPPMKLKICPPNGNPFYNFSMVGIHHMGTRAIAKKIINIIDVLVSKADDRSHRVLGAYYVLAALTLVSNGAAQAFPWLHGAVI